MIIKKNIKEILEELNDKYNLTNDPTWSTLYSKLAVMELCGWIEESFDKIAIRCVKGKVKTGNYKDIFESILDKNYGFKYNFNFRQMMLKTIGLKRMEELEISLDSNGEKDILKSVLDALTGERNVAAHTTEAGAMASYQAPSVTLNQLEKIYPIIKKMYSFAVQEGQ